jgi:Tfp pilus assembly protein PilF
MLCALLIYSCATTPDTEEIRDSEVLYKLGVSHINRDQLKEAFIKFQEAIKLNPEDKRSLNALGYISARFKEYDKAVYYYKRAISIDPAYSEAMNNLGVTYLETKNWDGAIKYFRMSLKNPLYSTPEKAYSNLGYALYKHGDYVQAERTLKDALTKYPSSYQSAYVLGVVYSGLGRIESSIEMLEKSVELAPYYIEARWELANLFLRIGDNKNALKHFQVIAESSGDNQKRKEALKYIELLRSP